MRLIATVFLALVLLVRAEASEAQTRVLWWNGTPDEPPNMFARNRETMARYVDAYGGGQEFDVTFRTSLRGGDLAAELAQNTYDIIVLDVVTRRVYVNGADVSAVQDFYASGKSALMLDGSLWIRNLRKHRVTQFPGVNGSIAGMTMNQLFVLADAGGGIFFGVDHNIYQAGANRILQALVPSAKFTGLTKPSTDGAFIGDALLAKREAVTAKDILQHWAAVPNQGEAPVGDFVDFLGRPVTLYSLVETADQPGGGRKRPYVSASVYPGAERTAIDSETSGLDNLPTHKGPSN